MANATEGALGGYDAAKRVEGIKRHIVVDTNGFLLAARVTEASVPEREGARALLGKLAQKKRRACG